ncbi:uncharacterized protein [Nerophis lumbriciformis]|uniref:uncharacterized protein n=1 Tax=Nerophis lumbriciformis TaxID=546530 RepID=UPI003BAA6533
MRMNEVGARVLLGRSHRPFPCFSVEIRSLINECVYQECEYVYLCCPLVLSSDYRRKPKKDGIPTLFSSPEEEEISTKRSHITPERYRNDEEDVFDADDEEEIRPKKKCRKEKSQILIQAPPLPVLPPLNFPISSKYQTTSASTSQYYTTPRHPGRPHSPARSSTYRLSPDRNHASSSSQYQTTPASMSQYQTTPRSSRNALESELFQLNMKVQKLVENQGEIMRMLRGLAAQSVGPEAVDVQDLIEKPFETLEQLKRPSVNSSTLIFCSESSW